MTIHTVIPPTRRDAKSAGTSRYFNGSECPKGHVQPRMTSNGRCVLCISIDRDAHRKRNPEQHLAYMAAWHAKNKEHNTLYRKRTADKTRIRTSRWYADNKKRAASNAKRWRDENLDRYKEVSRAWAVENRAYLAAKMREKRAANPEKYRMETFVRNSATRGVNTSIKHGFLRRQGRIQKWLCAFCRTSVKVGYHIDHIIPVSRGGTGHEGNLQLLCPPCNMSKGAKTRMEYIASGGRVVDGY